MTNLTSLECKVTCSLCIPQGIKYLTSLQNVKMMFIDELTDELHTTCACKIVLRDLKRLTRLTSLKIGSEEIIQLRMS